VWNTAYLNFGFEQFQHGFVESIELLWPIQGIGANGSVRFKQHGSLQEDKIRSGVEATAGPAIENTHTSFEGCDDVDIMWRAICEVLRVAIATED